MKEEEKNIQALEEKVIESLDYLDKLFDYESEPSAEDINGIIGRGMELTAASGLIAKTLVQAQELLKTKELYYMSTHKELWNSPTLLKKLMEGNLAKYYSHVMLADRYSATCVHKLDFYRSIISKYKEEIKMQ